MFLGGGDTTTLRNTSVLLMPGVSLMTSQPFIYDATGVMVTGNSYGLQALRALDVPRLRTVAVE